MIIEEDDISEDPLDFTTSQWITSFTTQQTIIRTVDDVVFTIIYDGKKVTINGFPVTKDDWDDVLKRNTVTLKSPKGNTATLTYKENTVYFNNNPLTGNFVSTMISSTRPSSTTGKF